MYLILIIQTVMTLIHERRNLPKAGIQPKKTRCEQVSGCKTLNHLEMGYMINVIYFFKGSFEKITVLL